MNRPQRAAHREPGDYQHLGLGTILRCHSDAVGVLVTHDERRLVTVRDIGAGDRLFFIEGRETPTPTRFSVQIGRGLHLDQEEARNADERVARYFWRYMNHHCEPSTEIRDRYVIARRDLAAGEDVTFDYNTTEYDLAEPFTCHCGSARCVGVVRGARHLTAEQRALVERILPDYLR
ncbi:MAG: SET domain-containing protein-lysine N-methyltransferase [Gemmatimonadaceae bacterium]